MTETMMFARSQRLAKSVASAWLPHGTRNWLLAVKPRSSNSGGSPRSAKAAGERWWFCWQSRD
jgi:hypothetical protein